MKLVSNMWLTPGRAVATREGKVVWLGSVTSPAIRELVCDELLLSPVDYEAFTKVVDHGLTPAPDAPDK